MKLEEKKKILRKRLEEIYAETGEYPMPYTNFFKFLNFYNTRKQHRLLDNALQDIENYYYSYPEDWYK